MKKSVVYTILSLAIVAAVSSALYTSTARAGSKANTRAGTYVIRWDFDKDTTTDLQNFGSLLKSGELILDGPVLPAALAGQANPVALGTGHGFWKFLPTANKYSFSFVFDDTSGSEKIWRLSGKVQAGDNNTFSGQLTLRRFASIDAESPESAETLGFIGGTDDGSSI